MRRQHLDWGMPNPKLPELVLSEEEAETLKRWARRPKTAQALALRSRIVLRCARGGSNVEVAEELGVQRATVAKWRSRFLADRLEGLLDEPRPGRPRTITDDQVEAVIVKTLESVPRNATHWSTRSMAAESGLTQSAVSRIWRAFGLQPHRQDSWKLSKDPQFVDKVKDVVGLYLDPPERAVVLCVDELGRTEARCRPYGRYVSSARPPNRTCVSPRIRLSASPCRWAMRLILSGSPRGSRCSPRDIGNG